jgi:catechol 2,3-dioxygenase-like lactoylglutathione lyase family enzyme
MEIQELHRGRLIDHIQLVVKDLAKSQAFYEAVIDILDIPMGGTGDDYFWVDELVVTSIDSPAAQGHATGRTHLAFQAGSKEMVDAFHRVALSQGGTDNGSPGYREYHPSYYAAFVLDPDGNNIEIVYHGPARRSASSVLISF